MGKMVVLYDTWNKLKSYSVLNRQGFEELVRAYNLAVKVDSTASAAFEKRLANAQISSLKAIDAAQTELEARSPLLARSSSTGLTPWSRNEA